MQKKNDQEDVGLFKANQNVKLSKFAGVNSILNSQAQKPSHSRKSVAVAPVEGNKEQESENKSHISSLPNHINSSERKDSESALSVMILKEEIDRKVLDLIEKEPMQNETRKECMMCLQRVPNTLFKPCGHGGVCFECSLEIMRNGNIECHYCRGVDQDNPADQPSAQNRPSQKLRRHLQGDRQLPRAGRRRLHGELLPTLLCTSGRRGF